MSVFNPYEHGARPVQSNNGNFNPLEHGAKPIQPQKEYSLGNRAASLGKSATAGALGAVPDTAALAYNLPAMGINAAMRSTDTSQPFDDDGVIPQLPQNMGGSFANVTQNKGHDLGEQAPQLPLIPSATHAISEGIDNLSDGYTETSPQDKALNQGVEFAAGVGGGGAIAKGAQALGKTGAATVAGFAGSTNKWHIGGAGAAGSTMSTLEDAGTSTGGAMAGGLAAGAAVNSIPNMWNAAKNIKSLPAKAAVAVSGLGKKNFNLEAAKNAQELGIDLPATPFTESTSTRLADQLIGKSPVLGNKLHGKYKNAEEQTKKALEDIYDSTGPRKTDEVQQEITNLYNQRVSELPKDAGIKPNHTIKAINDIKIDSIHPSQNEKALLDVVNSFKNELTPRIKNKFGDINIPVQESNIQRLADSKRSLNDLIKWDTDEGVKNQVRAIQKGLANDITEYGKTNPEWHKTFKEADDLFGKVAKRERLEKELGHKTSSFSDESISYNKLSKAIHDPKSKAILKRQASPEVLEKIEKLGTVAKAMAVKNKNVPNPSGTAMTLATTSFIYSMATNPIATITGAPIAVVGGALAATKLLTDKKVLDAAIKFAETGTEKAAVKFNVRMKAITGHTPVTLARETAKREEKEENKQGKGVRQKFNDHIETNKKRPKSQALKKLLNNPSVQKGAEILGVNPWKQ